MVNNFKLIKDNITFLNERSFYFVQILKRKKENPEQKSYTIPIENFYIFSKEQLDYMMPRIIEICEKNRARAYIKMNCLDAMSVMLENIAVLTQDIRKGDWKHMSAALNSACGICGKQDGFEKLYLVDLDGEYAEKKDEIKEFIENLQPIKYIEIDEYGHTLKERLNKVKLEIPTKNGIHLLVSGFDLKSFREVYPKGTIDVHEDGNTILYFPECCCN